MAQVYDVSEQYPVAVGESLEYVLSIGGVDICAVEYVQSATAVEMQATISLSAYDQLVDEQEPLAPGKVWASEMTYEPSGDIMPSAIQFVPIASDEEIVFVFKIDDVPVITKSHNVGTINDYGCVKVNFFVGEGA